MKLPRTQTTLAAVLLLAAAPFALATPQSVNQMPNTPGVTPPETTPSTTNNPGMTPPRGTSRYQNQGMQTNTDAARNAKVSLIEAISSAEQQNHGNVVSARFELRQGKPEYLIRTFDSRSRQEWLGHIDAVTGQVMGQGRTIPLSQLPKQDQQELTASQNSSTTLGQAVRTAEQQRGGKALSAGLSSRHGQVSYRTELLNSNGRTQIAIINPQSGRVSTYR